MKPIFYKGEHPHDVHEVEWGMTYKMCPVPIYIFVDDYIATDTIAYGAWTTLKYTSENPLPINNVIIWILIGNFLVKMNLFCFIVVMYYLK